MSDWITIDPDEINKEITKVIQGVSVKVSFSPYDVPRRFRGYKDPDSEFFIIEFEYLMDEETQHHMISPQCPVELEVGENSQRIYKIILDTKKLGSGEVQLNTEPAAREVVSAIEQFKRSLPDKLRERYKMPENIVFNKRNELFSGSSKPQTQGFPGK
jgi:hypothetical protein